MVWDKNRQTMPFSNNKETIFAPSKLKRINTNYSSAYF